MSRASFGGASDYSALFAAVYGNQQAESDAAARQAEYDQKQAAAEAKAVQAAADQDAADMWANGAMSNDEWLAYIAQRVAATTDPKEHEKWVKYQRKYTQDIAVNTAEFNYQNGGSINDLIAFYQILISGKEQDSTDTQKDILRLNALIDEKTTTDVSKGVQAIIDRINAGTGTYEELLAFEKQALSWVRPGSDIESQIKAEIVKVTDTIKTNKVEGALAKADYEFKAKKITGKQYAEIIKQQAEQYKTSNPKQYYEMLSAANEYVTKNPGLYGSGTGKSAAQLKKEADAKIKDRNLATRDNAFYYIDKYTQEGARQVPDFNDPNKVVTLTPEFIHKQDLAVLSSYDSDAAIAKANGDLSVAADIGRKKIEYVGVAQGHNTIAAKEAEYHILTAQAAALPYLQGALDMHPGVDKYGHVPTGAEDPNKAKYTFDRWIMQEAEDLRKVTNKAAVSINSMGLPVKTTGAALTGVEAVRPEYIEARKERLEVYTRLNSGQDISDAEAEMLMARLMDAESVLTGKTIEKAQDLPVNVLATAQAMLNNSNNIVGAAAGTSKLVINAAGQQQWVKAISGPGYTMYNEGGTVDPRPKFSYVEAGFTGEKNGTKVVDVLVEINGRVVQRPAVATLADTNLVAYRATKDIKLPDGTKINAGDFVKETQYDLLNELNPNWIQSSDVELAQAMGYYQVRITPTDASGKALPTEVWSQDPQTLQWVKGDKLHLRSVNTHGPGGTVVIDKDGQPAIIFYPDNSYPVPFAGTNPGEAQKKLNELVANGGLVNADEFYAQGGRDLRGNFLPSKPAHPADSAFIMTSSSGDPRLRGDAWYTLAERKRQEQSNAIRAQEAAERAKQAKAQVQAMFGSGGAPARDAEARASKDDWKRDSTPLVKFGESIGLNFGSPAEDRRAGGQRPKTPATLPQPGGLAGIINLNLPTVKIPPTTANLSSGPVSVASGTPLPTVNLPTYTGIQYPSSLPTVNKPPTVNLPQPGGLAGIINLTPPKATTPPKITAPTMSATKLAQLEKLI